MTKSSDQRYGYSQVMEYILYRLSQKSDDMEEVIFSYDEVNEWPEKLVYELKLDGILCNILKSKAHQVVCTGCEENCFMPVEVYQESNNRPIHSFIVCDKRDDIGRISVNPIRLTSWGITMQGFMKFHSKYKFIIENILKNNISD